MPEGPSIVILKQAVRSFKGQQVLRAAGNTTKVDLKLLKGKKISDFKSWGKHFLICFDTFTLRIHFLMFGSWLMNEHKRARPRLSLIFEKGKLNFYSCSVKMITGDLNELYDWRSDVMNKDWSPALARKKLKSSSGLLVCDALLDQRIFSGVGNIIKNEVLYRIRVHPRSVIDALPSKKLSELIREAVVYSFDFLKWKKKYVLRKHWLVHTKSQCVRCGSKISREYMGTHNRRTFFCPHCQKLYV